MVIKECCSLGYPLSSFVILRYGKIISLKNSIDLSVFDQWLFVKIMEKEFGKSNFGKQRRYFPRIHDSDNEGVGEDYNEVIRPKVKRQPP